MQQCFFLLIIVETILEKRERELETEKEKEKGWQKWREESNNGENFISLYSIIFQQLSAKICGLCFP